MYGSSASDYTLFRIEIDQDQGPIVERRNARYDWSPELEDDPARPNALQRQTLEAHSSPFRQCVLPAGIFLGISLVNPLKRLLTCGARHGWRIDHRRQTSDGALAP
jgi:hypothetical protein